MVVGSNPTPAYFKMVSLNKPEGDEFWTPQRALQEALNYTHSPTFKCTRVHILFVNDTDKKFEITGVHGATSPSFNYVDIIPVLVAYQSVCLGKMGFLKPNHGPQLPPGLPGSS